MLHRRHWAGRADRWAHRWQPDAVQVQPLAPEEPRAHQPPCPRAAIAHRAGSGSGPDAATGHHPGAHHWPEPTADGAHRCWRLPAAGVPAQLDPAAAPSHRPHRACCCCGWAGGRKSLRGRRAAQGLASAGCSAAAAAVAHRARPAPSAQHPSHRGASGGLPPGRRAADPKRDR